MARLTPSEAAQQLALQGKREDAITAFSALQQRGDTGANAAVAQFAAFAGRWSDVAKHASAVAVMPSSVKTMNVYVDMVNLLALAGIHLQNWADLKDIADAALKQLAKEKADKQGGQMLTARNLSAFAAAGGKRSYLWDLADRDGTPLKERAARFESAIDELAKGNKRFKTLDARRNHLFALARTFRYREGAVGLYDREGVPDRFDSVIFAASALASCGRPQDAWNAVRAKLPMWWPMEVTQIAPVELLTDEALRPLMTPERCDEVLRTPRGPAAATG
jgi:hypothetical protein